MPAFYDGQQDYIQKLNELYAYFMAGPFNAVPLAGGVTMTGPLTIPTLTVGSGGAFGITKAMVGLSNVDNTSDANKPLSTPQQNAIPALVKANLTGYKSVLGLVANRAVTAADIGAFIYAFQADYAITLPRPDSIGAKQGDKIVFVTLKGGAAQATIILTATGGAQIFGQAVLASLAVATGQQVELVSDGGATWQVGISTIITKTMVGLGDVDNTSDAAKPVSTAQAAALALKTSLGQRNRIDNSNFTVNQLGVSGTVTLAAGAYGHDRWKAGAAGCTYTFSTSQGVVTLNITAGTLVQVVDGSGALRGTGTYVTSWTGTAQGRFGASAYAASGFTTSLAGGTNATLEFGTGTLSQVQTELGTSATPYEIRAYADEYARCRWYFKRDVYTASTIVGGGQAYGTGTAYIQIPVPNDMRPSPTVSLSGGLARLGGEVVGSPGAVGLGPSGVSFTVAWSSTPFVSGDSVVLAAASTFTVSQDSNL